MKIIQRIAYFELQEQLAYLYKPALKIYDFPVLAFLVLDLYAYFGPSCPVLLGF